ncbi:nuclear transport factor 2 family protein [Flavobacterium oreochromis]|uniref:nuclear transport factor 2 family protein n=1 Tax=Flavobacterium oreochromis TaxID=2906078 RepID=UPI001CE6BD1E|nr:nuclear transport factor 2 family protein [Flavobacterium oreochromis]QYS87523.1 nuclear transport factor 2 family protein [Flavobacterium oreochromis]
MQKPTMQVWTDAWHNADAEVFKNVYSTNALIFPPNKPTIQGNDNILDFMKGGLGKVDVVFEAKNLIISENLAFEFGLFKDVELVSQKVTGEGNYSVTWILENSVWKVLCHTWSMPIKL